MDVGQQLYEALTEEDGTPCLYSWATAHPGDRAYWAQVESIVRHQVAEDLRVLRAANLSWICTDTVDACLQTVEPKVDND